MKNKILIIAGLVFVVVSYFAWQYTTTTPSSVVTPFKPVVSVATATVATHPVTRVLSLIGNLKSENSVVIASEVGGKIETVHVKAGENVKEGTLLLTLDTAKSQASFAEAEAFYQDEQRKLNEFTKLHKRGALTKTELDAQQANVDIGKARLDAAKEVRDDHFLTAPFDGTVGLVDITRGQLVLAGETLLHLDDLSLMQLDVNVPEQYLSDLSKNIKITANSKAWPNTPFIGKLMALDSRVNNDSLNLRVRINIENSKGLLLPGMMMEASLNFEPLITAVIPVQAIEYSGTKRFVYKLDEKKIANRTEVKLGARVDNLITVDSGLALGDSIVVQGLVNMRDGISVNPLNETPSEGN